MKEVALNNSEATVEVIMDRETAVELTEDIKSTTSALYILLKRAHDEKAWVAMGYKSWTEYVSEEFDFSRARSYQLINQANVIESINEASGVEMYITEREARGIKKRLPEITEKLREEVRDADLSEEEREAAAREIIEDGPERSEIDNSAGFDEEEVKETGPIEREEEPETYVPRGPRDKISLNDEDKFYYDNLLVTFELFEAFPDAQTFGNLISKSDEDLVELKRLAEHSFSWITKFLDEI